MFITENKTKQQLNELKERIENVTGNKVINAKCKKNEDGDWEIYFKLQKNNGLFDINKKDWVIARIKSYENEAALGIMLQGVYGIR